MTKEYIQVDPAVHLTVQTMLPLFPTEWEIKQPQVGLFLKLFGIAPVGAAKEPGAKGAPAGVFAKDKVLAAIEAINRARAA